MSAHLLPRQPLVEGEIELEHIHPRLTDKPEPRPFGCLGEERSHGLRRDPARLRHANHLKLGVRARCGCT